MADINYSDYIVFDKKFDPAFKKNVDMVLRQIASTPEGVEVIERAHKLHNGNSLTFIEVDNEDTAAVVGSGEIRLNREELKNRRYLLEGTDSKYGESSLNRVVFHELFHLSDPVTHKAITSQAAFNQRMKDNQEYMTREGTIEAAEVLAKRHLDVELVDLTYQNALQIIDSAIQNNPGQIDYIRSVVDRYVKGNNPVELGAIEATNAFMSKYYGESPRTLHLMVDDGTPELELYERMRSIMFAPSAKPSKILEQTSSEGAESAITCSIKLSDTMNLACDPPDKSEKLEEQSKKENTHIPNLDAPPNHNP